MTQKILIVDDDPDIALVLSDRIAALGYSTITAGDGVHTLLRCWSVKTLCWCS